MNYSNTLSQLFNIKEEYAQNIITLLDDGNTIPFIARYRTVKKTEHLILVQN